MRTTDLFKSNRSSKRLNESLTKTFGTTLDLKSFDTPKLEDARNKLRTQIHTARTESGFNETIENEALTKAQFMHDAIVAELAERNELIVDTTVQEGTEVDKQELMNILKRFDEDMNEIGGYGDPDFNKILAALNQGDVESAVEEVWHSYSDQDGGEINMDDYIEDLEYEFKAMVGESDDEGGETDDGYALASAGFGSDEDYESIEMERERDPEDWDEGNTEPANNFAVYINGKKWKVFKGRGYYADDERERAHYHQLQSWAQKKSDATGKKWTVHVTGEPATESIEQESAPPTAKGERMVKHIKKGYAKDGKLSDKEKSIAYATAWKQHNKEKNEDMNTNEAYINDAKDAINILADIRKQSKMAELGQGEPVRPNQLVNDLWDVMQWIENNMDEVIETESVENSGENMTKLHEGEIQQASAIVTAKTMVDRVGRWIEELSGMENDTLLTLGDSIRDEMGQEQAKAFISTCAPAIQAALENLKSARETLSGGVRALTGEEQPAEMLGGEPGDEMGGDEMGPVEPDAMNMGDEMGGEEDAFAAAEPGAGGLGDAGREQRESIDRSNSLLRVLAG